ncbi:MAG: hypothetical protein NVV70_03685 [Cellulomonas sp.]|nr:hypothetical protein [Cellulomonas sp.]MCR6647269.1 hypothetical protein [Cellulomonas sp.]
MTNTTTTYGGYAISNLREAGGEETLRFDGFLTLHGRKVIYLSNDGHGSSHRYQPVNEKWDQFKRIRSDFQAYATAWNAASEFAGLEDSDQLVNRLIEVALLNRLRKVPFLLDNMDFWADGEYVQLAGSASREQVVRALNGPQYADRYPRVWDREAGDFLPVSGLAQETR